MCFNSGVHACKRCQTVANAPVCLKSCARACILKLDVNLCLCFPGGERERDGERAAGLAVLLEKLTPALAAPFSMSM